MRAYLDAYAWYVRSRIDLEPQEEPEDLSRDVRVRIEAIEFEARARGGRPQEISDRVK